MTVRPTLRRPLLAVAAVAVALGCTIETTKSRLVSPPPPAPQAAAAPAAAVPPEAVLLPVAGDPTVSFALWIRAGSQDDPPGKEGLASLVGRLIAEGSTTSLSYSEILERLYPLASAYQVRVDKEMTTLTGRTHRDNLAAFTDLFTAAYLEPAFAEEDFERLRSEALNGLETTLRYASDEELAKAALTSAAYRGSRYAHPVAGTVAGLGAITLDDVRDFYRRRYTAANVTVALGGGYDDALVARLRATLDKLPPGAPAAAPPPLPAKLDGRRVLLVSKPGADASISFGFPLDVQRGERDFYALWLATSWLGEHRSSSSHLYQVIRSARGLNYGDYAYVEAYPEGGRRQIPPPNVGRRSQLFEVWIRTLPNAQAHFALRAAMRELTRLVEDGMTPEAFALTQSFLGKYRLHFAPTTQMRLGYAIDDRFYGIPAPGHLARFGEVIASLGRDEVNAALRRHFQTRDLQIAIVSGEAESLREALVSDAPSPITYPTPKPESVLAEDEEIARFPLRIAPEAVEIVPVDAMFER